MALGGLSKIPAVGMRWYGGMAKKRRCYRLMRCLMGSDWDRLPDDWIGRVYCFFGVHDRNRKKLWEKIATYALATFFWILHFTGEPIDKDMDVFLDWLGEIRASLKEWIIGWFG